MCRTARVGATVPSMTAKEKLIAQAPTWSEEQAERALLAAESELKDPVLVLLDNAPEEDEEITAEEEAAAAEGRADIAAGRTISHEDMLRKYG